MIRVVGDRPSPHAGRTDAWTDHRSVHWRGYGGRLGCAGTAGDPGSGGMEGREERSSGNLPQIQFLHGFHGEPLYRYSQVHSR